MTMELVTGHAGEPHVTAAQDAALHAGVIGGDDYVLSTKDRFAINVVSANKVTIAGGDLVMQGYHASNDKPADLIITNGSQGQKRNDIICCRYTKVGDSIESANLVVVKGTPTTGTPVDPTLNTTPISQGATTYDMPLYRIPLDGITIGTPVALFNVLKPMSDVWDSLTQTCQLKFQDTSSFVPAAYGASNTITVKDGLIFVDLSSFRSTVHVGDYPVWLFKEGVKPSKPISLGCVANVTGAAYGKQARWNTDGSVTIIGGVGSSDIVQCFSRIISVPDGVEFV